MKRTARISELIAQNRDFEILDTIEEGVKRFMVHNHLTQALLGF